MKVYAVENMDRIVISLHKTKEGAEKNLKGIFWYIKEYDLQK